MSSVQRTFERIHQMTRGKDIETTKRIAQKEFEKSTQRSPELKAALEKFQMSDFITYKLETDAKEWLAKRTTAPPDAQQLWDAVAKWKDNGTESEPTPLAKLMSSERFGPVPLGKLRGEIPLALMPELYCIGSGENAFAPDLEYADTDTDAISYADGYPSENQLLLTMEARNDDVLRRFVSLGWVMMARDGQNWKKTGHVLVIDADEGRHHRSWFILAYEWETDEEHYPDEGANTGMLRPPKRVKRDDSKALGVLPGNSNRTTIAYLIHYAEADETVPFVKYFGPDFAFDFKRFGKERKRKDASQWGPDLVEIMDWYWDPKEKKDICFNKAGQVYMTYDSKTGEYGGPYAIPPDEVGNIVDEPPRGPRHLQATLDSDLQNLNIVAEGHSHHHGTATSWSAF